MTVGESRRLGRGMPETFYGGMAVLSSVCVVVHDCGGLVRNGMERNTMESNEMALWNVWRCQNSKPTPKRPLHDSQHRDYPL